MLVLVASADQFSKWLVTSRCIDRDLPSRKAVPVRIRLVTNRKLPIGSAQNKHVLLALWIVLVLSIIIIAQFGPLFRSAMAQVGLGIALGGSMGNLCDILWRKGVVDFIDLRIWPLFNLADASIVAGVALALLYIY
ncbi:MAG TPA: signal peptidase II [Chloroflexia bacterium]